MAAQVSTPTMVRSFTAMGNDIAYAGIEASTAVGLDEFFLDGDHDGPYLHDGEGSYWFALRFDAVSSDYVQTFTSLIYPTDIKDISILDLHGNPGEEIVVAFEDGEIRIHDQVSKELLETISTGVEDVVTAVYEDLDGSGAIEIALLSDNGLHIHDLAGASLALYPSWTGYDLVAGQMDADPSMELASTDGSVLDYLTGIVQCAYAPEFGRDLEVFDFDGDGMEELLFLEYSGNVRAFDVDTCLLKWSIPVGRAGSITLGDSDQDGVVELLVAESDSLGDISSFDLTTLATNWAFQKNESGATSVTLADTDQDGVMEVLWAYGGNSTGEDVLMILDPIAQVVEYESIDLRGPFAGPAVGDVDGDGVDEIVSLTFESEGGQGAGRIVVLEQGSLAAYISQGTLQDWNSRGSWDVKLFDFNGDGDMEILIGGKAQSSGLLEIWDFAPGGVFTMIWDNDSRPGGATFHAVDACDLDGDGILEILGGLGDGSSASNGTSVHAYDLATGDELWQTLHMGGYWDDIKVITHGDFDGDGALEIAAMVHGGDVYVFRDDGTLEAVIVGEFTSMRAGPDNVGATRSILAGTEDGVMEAYFWTGFDYQPAVSWAPLTAPLDGIALPYGVAPTAFLGSEGTLLSFRFDTGKLELRSDYYGDLLGRQVIPLANGDLVSASNAGIFVFDVQ